MLWLSLDAKWLHIVAQDATNEAKTEKYRIPVLSKPIVYRLSGVIGIIMQRTGQVAYVDKLKAEQELNRSSNECI